MSAPDLAIDDAAYRARLAAIEAGEIIDGDPAVAELVEAAEARLYHAFGAEAHRWCADAFAYYPWRVHGARAIKQHGEKIQNAALALAEALAASGQSDHCQLLDPVIWGDCPDDFDGPNIRIEDYLRILAAHFDPRQFDARMPGSLAELVPGRHSANLRRFVVKHVHAGLVERRRWEAGADPEDARAPYGMNKEVATIAGVLLADTVTAEDVRQAIKK